jgi:hypothetical protein
VDLDARCVYELPRTDSLPSSSFSSLLMRVLHVDQRSVVVFSVCSEKQRWRRSPFNCKCRMRFRSALVYGYSVASAWFSTCWRLESASELGPKPRLAILRRAGVGDPCVAKYAT